MCDGHGGLDFGVHLSRWLLVFWRWMGFHGLRSVSLWVAYGSIEIDGCFVLCGFGGCCYFCGGCGHCWLLMWEKQRDERRDTLRDVFNLILNFFFFNFLFPKHRMVFFLKGRLINWVLETWFPSGRHIKKTPHQTWSDHENRVSKTQFISPKSSLLNSIC